MPIVAINSSGLPVRRYASAVAGILTAIVLMLAMAVAVSGPASAAAGGSTLSAGQELHAGQDLVSAGAQYTL